MTKTFITFGDDHYAQTRARLCREVAALSTFDQIIPYAPADLSPDFLTKHKKFIDRNPRGHGYWIWKPQVILQTLQKLNDSDLLTYADAGCAIDPKNASRLQHYFQRVQIHPTGLLAFELQGMPNHAYTKMDTIQALHAENHAAANMLIATVITLRKCPASLALLQDWQRHTENYALLNDSPSSTPNHPTFQSHRHDQSLFSLLARQQNVDTLPDETYGPTAKSPILAARLRPKLPFLTKLKRSLLKRRATLKSHLHAPP